MTYGKFKSRKPHAKTISSQIKSDIIYSPSFFGFRDIVGDGSGIKICILDSGVPNNQDNFNKQHIIESVDFTNSKYGSVDMYGHSTQVAGIVSSNGRIKGLAYKSDMYYAKVLDDQGQSDFNSIVGGLLWATIKRVDIIVMSLGCVSGNQVLHDAICKAYNSGISIFAAAGNNIDKNEIDYPARYGEVMAVGFSGKKNNIKNVSKKDFDPIIFLSNKNIQTTYLNNTYSKMSGSSALSPIAAGIAARMMQPFKEKGSLVSPQIIYSKLLEYIYGK